MYRMFEEIFWGVAEELGITEWWVLFDSDDFQMVENRISECLGYECWAEPEFRQWYQEMAEEL